MKAPLIKELKLQLYGVSPLDRLSGLIVLGLELRHLKISLGYYRALGRPPIFAEVRPKWGEICRNQAGITDETEQILFQCGAAVKARLAKSGCDEAAKVLALMETQPSKLSDEDRQSLVEGIRQHALMEGDSQKVLRREFQAAAAAQPPKMPQPAQGQPDDESAGIEDERLRRELMEDLEYALPQNAQGRPLDDTSLNEQLDRRRRELMADLSHDEAILCDLDRRRLDLIAMAMGCGISETRARAAANFMFVRGCRRNIRKPSAADDNPQPGRDQL